MNGYLIRDNFESSITNLTRQVSDEVSNFGH